MSGQLSNYQEMLFFFFFFLGSLCRVNLKIIGLAHGGNLHVAPCLLATQPEGNAFFESTGVRGNIMGMTRKPSLKF